MDEKLNSVTLSIYEYNRLKECEKGFKLLVAGKESISTSSMLSGQLTVYNQDETVKKLRADLAELEGHLKKAAIVLANYGYVDVKKP